MTARPHDHPGDEMIFAIAHEQGDPAQREAVLTHIRNCERCASLLKDAARTRDRAAAAVPAWDEVPSQKPARRPATRRVAAVLAASAAVIVFLALVPRDSGVDTRPVYWMPTGVESANMRSRSVEIPADLLQALARFEARRPAESAAALQALTPAGHWSELRDVYLVAALVNAGDHATADSVYARLDAPTLPYRYRMSAFWYRYVMLTETGRRAEAEDLLPALAASDTEPGIMARKELQKLGASARAPRR